MITATWADALLALIWGQVIVTMQHIIADGTRRPRPRHGIPTPVGARRPR